MQKLYRPNASLFLTFYCVLAWASTTQASDAPARLGNDVRPTFQTIDLTIDPRQSDYSGSVRIDLQVREATDLLRFHSRDHELVSLGLTRENGDEVAIMHELEDEDVIAVKSEDPLAVGAYELKVEFKATFSTQIAGLFRTENEAGAYVHTIFQPVDARRAFPCWDEPAWKIPFQVSLRVPADFMAISNTPEEKATSADGWRTVVFRKTPPLPSYDVAVAVGPFETVPITGLSVPGRVITAPGRAHQAAVAATMTPPILRALEEYFGTPHPYAKLDLLAAVGFPEGAFEAPGAVLFGESLLLLDSAAASTSQRQRLVEHLGHEIAHMWFGNLVTLKLWDDIWLNESFATWMGTKIAHQVFPELGIDARHLRAVGRALDLDAQAGTPPIRYEFAAPEEAFSANAFLTYNKGSQVLSMFENWVGEKPFRRAINAYLKEHAGGSASAEDFLRALDKSTGKDVSTAFKTFLDQSGFPLIEVTFAEHQLVLRQERFRNHGAPADTTAAASQLWQIPVTLEIHDGKGSHTRTFLLEKASQQIELPMAPEWILPNADGSAYYRWSLPAGGLERLAGEDLTSLERLGLVANAGALLQAGRLTGDAHMELLTLLAADPGPALLNALIDAHEIVETTFVTEGLREPYAAYLRQTLGPSLERLGLVPKKDEEGAAREVRNRLYYLLGKAGHDIALRRHARQVVDAFLAGKPVRPELLAPSLKLAALEGDAELFKKYRARFKTADPMHRRGLVEGMVTFPNDPSRKLLLNEFLTGEMGLNEFFSLTFHLGSDDSTAPFMFQWLRENYTTLQESLPPFAIPLLPRISAGRCSTEHLVAVEVFFGQPVHRFGGTEAQMAQEAGRVRDCANLREREGATVARYLARN